MAEEALNQEPVQEEPKSMADILYPPEKEEEQDEQPGITEDPTALENTDEAKPEEPEKEEPEKAESEGEPEGDPDPKEPEENQAEGTEGDEGEEGETITSFAALVEHQDWDADWANDLTVPVKVDGETSERSIADLVASYQKQEAADKRLEDAKEKAKTIVADAEEKTQDINTKGAELGGLIQLAERLFGIQANEEHLAKLQETDPAAYLVAKDQLKERQQAIAQVKQAARQSLESLAEPQGMTDEEVQVERDKLLELIPEWKGNAELAQQQATEIVQYAGDKYGVTPDEIMNSDHRTIDMMRKAMLWDASRSKVQSAKKKVVKIPTKVTKTKAAAQKSDKGKRDHADILYGKK